MKKKKWYQISGPFLFLLATIWMIIGLASMLDYLNSTGPSTVGQIISWIFLISVIGFTGLAIKILIAKK